MKLAFVLLVVPCVWAYNDYYAGFNMCGANGWRCDMETYTGKKSVTFDCRYSEHSKVQLWTWTARIPRKVQIFIIMNCHHVELYMDCTRGQRDSDVREMKLINIDRLDILEPTNPSSFLHDNAKVAHVPEVFYLEDIKSMNFRPGLFLNASDECKYKDVKLKTLILKNVYIPVLDKNAIDVELDNLIWSKVHVRTIHENSININGNVSITGSYLPKIPSGAIRIKGTTVKFTDNRIGRIEPGGITLHSYDFRLERNIIEEIKSHALAAWSFHVKMEKNAIYHMALGALEGISPYYFPVEIEMAQKFTYSFVGNEIEHLSPVSLHNNWEIYKNICVEIVIGKNKIECTCENIQWLDNFENSKIAGFYHIFQNSTNFCLTADNCTLSMVAPNICSNKTNDIKTICSELNQTEIPESHDKSFNDTYMMNNITVTDSEYDSEVEDNSTQFGNQHEINSFTNPIEEIVSHNKSYYQDQSDKSPEALSIGTAMMWTVVLILFVIVAVALAIIFTWWLKKHKNACDIEDTCEYHKNNDTDKLIMNVKMETNSTECHNILFDN